MRRLVQMALLLWAARAQADTSLPRPKPAPIPHWREVCVAAIEADFAQHPELGKPVVGQDRDDLLFVSMAASTLDLRASAGSDVEGDWEPASVRYEGCQGDECGRYDAYRQLGPLQASVSTDRERGRSFRAMAERVVEPCAAAARAEYEPAGYPRWQSACVGRLRAAIARVVARDANFAGTMAWADHGVDVPYRTAVGGARFAAHVLPDEPRFRALVDGWNEVVGDCNDARTRCEILRGNGFVGYFVSPPRGLFVEEIKPALQACMRPLR
jgi:hypothetical protein